LVPVNRQKKHPHIAILPTALYKCGFDSEDLPYKNSTEHGIYIVPYSDHSPYEELFTFISQLKPAKLYPIVNETKMSGKKILSYQEPIKTFSTLPQSLYELCSVRKKDSTDCQNKELAIPCITKKLNVLPSEESHKIRHTKSNRRPGTVRNKKLPKASDKKGVHFESFHTSDEDDEISQIDVRHTAEEREEFIVRTSGGKYTTVKIPRNIKNNLKDAQVKLFDISNLWKGVAQILNRLNASNRKTCLRDLSYMCNGRSPSRGREYTDSYRGPTYSRSSPCKEEIASEESDSCPSRHCDLDNPFQELSLSHGLYIKDLVVKPENDETDCASICSVSTVSGPGSKLSEKEEDIADVREHFEDMVMLNSLSVKEEDTHKHDIYSDGENEDSLRSVTEGRLKNAIVMFPSDSDGDSRLWESFESDNSAETMKFQFQPKPRRSFYRRRWNRHVKCHTFDERTPMTYSTQKGIMKQSARLRKRNTELVSNMNRDSDGGSSTDVSFMELKGTNKRYKSYIKQNTHCIPQPWCSSCINGTDTSKSHDRKSEAALNNWCKSSLDKTSCDTLRIVSVKSLSEPNMQQLGTETDSWSEVSLGPSLSTCPIVQPIVQFIDENQDLPGPHTCCTKDNTILAAEKTVTSGSKASYSNITLDLENVGTSSTATCFTNITFNKQTGITSEICTSESFEEPHQALVTLRLSENEREVLAPCSMTCKRLEEGLVNTQSNELSFCSSTTSKQQSEVASNKFRNISNSEEGAKSNVNGRSIDICPTKNSLVNSSLEQNKSDLLVFPADERTKESHSKYREKNSSISQTERLISHSPSSYIHNVLQTDQRCHSVGVQCELLSDNNQSDFCHNEVCPAATEICFNNDSANIPSKNPVRIVNLLQDMEVFTTESGGVQSSQSNESEEVNIARRKHISSKLTFELHKPSNISNIGSKNYTGSSSSKSSAPITDDVIVEKSYSLKKRSNHENARPSNKIPFTNDSILQNNKVYEVDTTVQNINQNVAVVITDKSSDSKKNNRDVRNMAHNIGESDRILTSVSEASMYPENAIKCKPSTNEVDYNYWTNGNKAPFAMVEVFLAAQKIYYTFHGGDVHIIGPPLYHCNASESSSISSDEVANCQQNHTAVPLSTELPGYNYKCNINKHVPLPEQCVRKKPRGGNCCKDYEVANTVSDKTKPVNDCVFCATGGSPRRLISQDRFSDSNRSNAQIRYKTTSDGSAVPLHLHALGESFIGSSPCSIIGNTSTTCEKIITYQGDVPESTEISGVLKTPKGSDNLDENRIAPGTPEGSDDMLGENRVAPGTPEGSDDMLGENRVVPETPEGLDGFRHEYGIVLDISEGSVMLGKNGVAPETLKELDNLLGDNREVPAKQGGSDDMLGESRVAPEISEVLNDFLGKNEVTPEKPEGSGDMIVENGVAPGTSEGSEDVHHKNGVEPELSVSSSREKFQFVRREDCKEITYTKSSTSSDLSQRKTGFSNEVVQSTMARRGVECSEKLLRNIKKTDALGNDCEDNFPTRSIFNDHRYCKTAENGSSAQERHEFRSPNTVSKESTLCQLYFGTEVLSEENELSSSYFLQVEKAKTKFSDNLFTKNDAVGEKEERKSINIPSGVSPDDMFLSNQVIKVAKTYERPKHSKDVTNKLIQNSLNLYVVSKNTPSEIDSKPWRPYQAYRLVGKIEIKENVPRLIEQETELKVTPSLRQYKRKHNQSSLEHSSSLCKRQRLSNAT